FPQFGQTNQRGRNDGKLWYNAVQISYGIRAKGGMNLTFAYTHSKAIAQGGFDSGVTGPPNGNTANQAFTDPLKCIPERSVTTYDTPNIFKISTVYELPFGKGKHYMS